MNYARAGRKRMAMHDFHKKSWPFHAGRLHNFLSAPANLQWKVKGVRAIANILSHDFYFFMGHLSLSRLCEWNRVLFFGSSTNGQPTSRVSEREKSGLVSCLSIIILCSTEQMLLQFFWAICHLTVIWEGAERNLQRMPLRTAIFKSEPRAQRMHLLLSERENYYLTP